ncbi:hypothetical protein [Propioniciclava tarda]|uniref:hypothetical protein n=1 Tax=Propioniciclava tarda TaxID=433330 RepID=UPI00116D5D5E|nr:hypothetical protein [Propioniciclava tarda]SMO77738.1 hypothetical protein SAMN06266982_11829 [Propioniciclava tarda]
MLRHARLYRVIVGAINLTLTGFRFIDAIVAVAIGLLILPRTWNLMRQALRILMEVAPPGSTSTRQRQS